MSQRLVARTIVVVCCDWDHCKKKNSNLTFGWIAFLLLLESQHRSEKELTIVSHHYLDYSIDGRQAFFAIVLVFTQSLSIIVHSPFSVSARPIISQNVHDFGCLIFWFVEVVLVTFLLVMSHPCIV